MPTPIYDALVEYDLPGNTPNDEVVAWGAFINNLSQAHDDDRDASLSDITNALEGITDLNQRAAAFDLALDLVTSRNGLSNDFLSNTDNQNFELYALRDLFRDDDGDLITTKEATNLRKMLREVAFGNPEVLEDLLSSDPKRFNEAVQLIDAHSPLDGEEKTAALKFLIDNYHLDTKTKNAILAEQGSYDDKTQNPHIVETPFSNLIKDDGAYRSTRLEIAGELFDRDMISKFNSNPDMQKYISEHPAVANILLEDGDTAKLLDNPAVLRNITTAGAARELTDLNPRALAYVVERLGFDGVFRDFYLENTKNSGLVEALTESNNTAILDDAISAFGADGVTDDTVAVFLQKAESKLIGASNRDFDKVMEFIINSPSGGANGSSIATAKMLKLVHDTNKDTEGETIDPALKAAAYMFVTNITNPSFDASNAAIVDAWAGLAGKEDEVLEWIKKTHNSDIIVAALEHNIHNTDKNNQMTQTDEHTAAIAQFNAMFDADLPTSSTDTPSNAVVERTRG